MSVVRKTMKFLVPVTIDALGRNDLSGRTIIPLYLNPQSMSIQETKIINKQLTKGGFVIQYWGEELPTISVSGTTGSGGIEAINILRSIYRHEQLQFNVILQDRARLLDKAARESLENTTAASVGAGVTSMLDEITGGAFSEIADGVSSFIEEVTDAALGISDSVPNRVELIPTLASFATSIDLFWQGETFRGYFQDFNVDENAATPGHFDYKFTFTVIKRTGERGNFMPWHRSPYDLSGAPIVASIPPEGSQLQELSFPTSQQNILGTTSLKSTFNQTQEGPSKDVNSVSINRLSKIKTGK